MSVEVHDTPHGPGGDENEDNSGDEDEETVEEARRSYRQEAGLKGVHHDPEFGRPGIAGEPQGKSQTEEGVDPDAEGEPDPEDNQGRLDDRIGDGPPTHRIAQRRLQPSEEAGAGHEGVRVDDVLVQKASG